MPSILSAVCAAVNYLAHALLAGESPALVVGGRARQPNPLAGGEQEFLNDPAGFAADFGEWLVDARQFAGQWTARKAAV